MRKLLQTGICPCLPLLPLPLNTVCNCQSSFFFLPSMNTFMDKYICTFPYISNPTANVQKIREHRKVALVHWAFAEKQFEWIPFSVHSVLLLLKFLNLKLWGKVWICIAAIGAVYKQKLYSNFCYLEQVHLV